MSEAPPPAVAVILLNWNGWRDTVECLSSLAGLAYPAPAYDVIVCDNGSTDGSVERVVSWAQGNGWPFGVIDRAESEGRAGGRVEWRLTVLDNGVNAGFSVGNNVGIRLALGSPKGYRYVWVLNNDTVVESGALATLVTALEQSPCAAVAQSLLLRYTDREVIDSVGVGLRARGGAVDLYAGRALTDLKGVVGDREAVEVFGCCAASALYRAEALRDVGLFDESFFLMNEDVDLACRLRGRGYIAVLGPKSVVYHKAGVSRQKKSGRLWFIGNRNKMMVVARWWPRGRALPILALGALRAAWAVGKSRDVHSSEWTAFCRTVWNEFRGGASARERQQVFEQGVQGWLMRHDAMPLSPTAARKVT